MFLGDIFTQTDHNLTIKRKKFDYVFANLESSLYCDQEYPAPRVKGKKICTKSDPKYIKKFDIDVVSLANNHIWDYGDEGFYKTIEYLNKWGWKYTGAGKWNDDIQLAKTTIEAAIKQGK